MNKTKIGLISSPGGHFFQLHQLKKWWQQYPHFWVTANSLDTKDHLKKEKVYYAFFPEHRNIKNAIKNLFLAIKILLKEKPNLLISCGAGIAPPFFLIGKILGCKLIFLELLEFNSPTLTAKMVHPLVNIMLIQNKKQNKKLKKAEYWGKTI
ncbi:UDP-N-acetylglucosamine--LPS N-acetylglucosamine transferase [Patescibacteria group bacterium]|nr:UDP-N-acetylglucosamine--LPS N-acetylglucosamine transferase [Patescibacteria group bacterium]